jgi:hypothetical protein
MTNRPLPMLFLLALLGGCGDDDAGSHPTTRGEFEAYIEQAVKEQDPEAINRLRYQPADADIRQADTGARLIDFKKVKLDWRPYPEKDLRTWQELDKIPVPAPSSYLIVKDVANHDKGTARYDIPVGRLNGKLYFSGSKPAADRDDASE